MTQPTDPKPPDSQAPGAAEGSEAGASRRMPAGTPAHPVSAPQAPSRRYSNYVLGVLVLVYVFNFIDRQILSILAEDIRNDLGVSDAQSVTASASGRRRSSGEFTIRAPAKPA